MRTSVVEHGSSAELSVLEICQRAWRLGHRIRHRRRAYPKALCEAEKRLPISARIGCHRPQLALLEERVVIAERRNVRQPDASHRERPAAIKRTQGDRHQLA